MDTYGQITSIQTVTVQGATKHIAQVRLAGDTHDTAIDLTHASYTPAVGDSVHVVRFDLTFVIVGKIEPIPAP